MNDYTDRDAWPTQTLVRERGFIDDEIARRARLAVVPAQDQERAEQIARDVAAEPVRAYEGGVWLPGQVMIVDDEEYRNTSGVTLTVGPDVYPMGYQLVNPPGDAAPWAPDEEVELDDLREYGGTVYRCITAHTTQAGWEPPVVPALWTVA